MLAPLAVLMLLAGALAIAGGIVLLVVGSRRHDDSSSRPFLAFGVTALVIGTVLAVPALLSLASLVSAGG
jgi:uncharacterized membrane protein HdeD (DUF308 family)